MLIECVECKNKISDQAEICPYCGVKTMHGLDKSIEERFKRMHEIDKKLNANEAQMFKNSWF